MSLSQVLTWERAMLAGRLRDAVNIALAVVNGVHSQVEQSLRHTPSPIIVSRTEGVCRSARFHPKIIFAHGQPLEAFHDEPHEWSSPQQRRSDSLKTDGSLGKRRYPDHHPSSGTGTNIRLTPCSGFRTPLGSNLSVQSSFWRVWQVTKRSNGPHLVQATA